MMAPIDITTSLRALDVENWDSFTVCLFAIIIFVAALMLITTIRKK